MCSTSDCTSRSETRRGAVLPNKNNAAEGLVYVIPSESMGRGSEELGWALLQNFIRTIPDITPMPSSILFYNSGVKTVCSESKALDALRTLEQKGVKILSCGTCIAYFSLSGKLKVGRDTSMPEIMNIMAMADKVVSSF